MASPFKMKGSPYKAETSPLKQWYNPFNKEVKSERVDSKSYGGFGEDSDGPTSTETKSRTYQNRLTGNRKVKSKTTKKSGGPGAMGGSRTETRTTTTKQKQYGKKKVKSGYNDGVTYDTREHKSKSQKVKNKTKIEGGVRGGKYKFGDKTKTTDNLKFVDSKTGK